MQDIKFEVIKKLTETRFKFRNLSNISKLDSNSPPSVFIGSGLRYPMVNVGILSPLDHDENAWLYDSPGFWSENNFQISDVMNLRDSLLNSRFRSTVNSVKSSKRFLQIAQEIAVASKPVDVEIELKNRLNLQGQKDRIATPHGIQGRLKKARITSNVRIHRKVEKVMNDDLKAGEAINYLYKRRFSEYTLSKILSIGVLGLKTGKKLVPTRWSITATDDTIGKHLLRQVRDYKIIENHELFFGEFMGNQYLILLFPEVFNFELFELYMPGSAWNPSQGMKAATDFEDFFGRKTYASNTSGGYYATRLPILEYLNKNKRQASALAIRIETPGYWAGLGVWVVRESVRKSLMKRMSFSTKEELMNACKQIGMIKFKFNPESIIKRSKILNEVLKQKKLSRWF